MYQALWHNKKGIFTVFLLASFYCVIMTIISTFKKLLSFRRPEQRGQGLVEFALILPLLLLIIAGVIEFGRMLAIYNGVSNAAREAARYGSVVGDPGNGASYFFLDCAGMRSAAKASSPLVTLNDGDITIKYDHGNSSTEFGTCTQGTQPSPNITNGDRVVITVTTTYSPILPLLPIGSRTFSFSAARSIFPDIAGMPECADGVDNDLDTLIDFPADPDCPSSAGTSEGIIPCYRLTTNIVPSGAGTVGFSPATNCAGGQYFAATTVTLSQSANTGYTFNNWTDGSNNVLGNGATINQVMTSDKTVNANFIANCYTLTITATNGSVAANPVENCVGGYSYPTVVTLTASNTPGYNFSSWSGDLTGSSNPANVTMDNNKSVTANYVSVPCYTLTTGVASGSGSVGAPNPSANCNTQYNSGTVVTLTASADPGFVFTNWTDSGGSPISTSNPVSVTIDDHKTYNANFVATSCYSLSLAAGSGGTAGASPAPNCGANYYSGTVVTLTATPNSGYSFANWSGDASGSTSPINITMDANKSVTANFNANCYTLTTTANPTTGGSISANPTSSGGCAAGQYTAGTSIQLTAAANSGYTFSSWSGGASGGSNPVSITMPASNTAVTARFNALCMQLASDTFISTSSNTVQLDYTNYTGVTLNLTQVRVTFPTPPNSRRLNNFGYLDAAPVVIWSGNATTGTTINSSSSGWNASANTGISDTGTRTLRLQFSFNVAGTGSFTVQATFNDGCSTISQTKSF